MKQFLYRKDIKNYVNIIDKPVTIKKLHSRNTEEEKEIILLSSECLFCENPEWISNCSLDIRGIIRRVAVGNFCGAVKIFNKFLIFNSPSTIDFKLFESTCIKKRFNSESVKIEMIIKYLKANIWK